jgi:transposase, IS30 family
MYIKYYTTEHRKWKHLLPEERHEIEVRLKDGWAKYQIAKHLGRPYNTIKNEISRGTVSLYNGKVNRYRAEAGKQKYLENRRNSRRKYRRLQVSPFIKYVEIKFRNG